MGLLDGRRLYDLLPLLIGCGAVFAVLGDAVVQALANRPVPAAATAAATRGVQELTEEEFERAMQWKPDDRALTPEEIAEGLDKLAAGARNSFAYELRLSKEPDEAVAAVARERIATALPITADSYEAFTAYAGYLPEDEQRAFLPAMIEAYPTMRGTDTGAALLHRIASSGTNEGIQFYLAQVRANPDTDLEQVGYSLSYGVFQSESLPLAGKAAIAEYLREVALAQPEQFVEAGLHYPWLKADRIGAVKDLTQPPLWQPEAPWHPRVVMALARERVALPEQLVRDLLRRHAPTTSPGMPLPADWEERQKFFTYAACVSLLARLHVPDVDPMIDDLYARGLVEPAVHAEAMLLGVTDVDAVVDQYRAEDARATAPEAIRHYLALEEAIGTYEEEGMVAHLVWFEGEAPETELIAGLEHIRAGRAIVAIRDLLAALAPNGAPATSEEREKLYEALSDMDRKRLSIVLDRIDTEFENLTAMEVVLVSPEPFRSEPPRALAPYTTKRPRR